METFKTTMEARRRALELGYREWFTGTKWMPMLQVSGGDHWLEVWIDTEKDTLRARCPTGPLYGWKLRR